jgi:hypothetical protein
VKPVRSIGEVLAERTVEWMAIPGVVGTAVGELDGKRCIKVFVAERAYELAARLPTEVEGHRVVIEQTGEFRAL